MAMSVTYVTINGVLVEEGRSAIVTTYVPDTLGSVIKTIDEAGNVTSNVTYWPFGEVSTSDGNNPSPWRFCETWGYYAELNGRLYVRARGLASDHCRWLSLDPVWPEEQPYAYVNNDPLDSLDFTGTRSFACVPCASCLSELGLNCYNEPDFFQCIEDILSNSGDVGQACRLICGGRLQKGRGGRGAPGPRPIRGGGGRTGGGPRPVVRPTPRPNPGSRCQPRENPGFPKGRRHQNCYSYVRGCNPMWGWSWRGSDGLRCSWRCKSSGIASLLQGGCDFWNWRIKHFTNE